MTLNDFRAVMDQEYLMDMLEFFKDLFEDFEKKNERKIRASFTPYMFAPARRVDHPRICEYNAIIVEANSKIFGTGTYDPNIRLLRPVKTGKPGNTTITLPDGSQLNFHSDTLVRGNWQLSGAYHVSDKKLRQICKDLRVFFTKNLTEGNGRPWDAYEMDLDIELDNILPLYDPDDQFPSIEMGTARSFFNSADNRVIEESPKSQTVAGPSNRTLGDFMPSQQEEHGGARRKGKGRTQKDEERKAKIILYVM